MRFLTLSFVLLAACASAQTPQQQPLVQPSNLVYLGSFTLPTGDGTGRPAPNGSLTYGGVIGVTENGLSLYYKCSTNSTFFAQVSIPALGGVAKVEKPCTFFARQLIDADGMRVGGAFEHHGKFYVGGYVYYDNGVLAPTSIFRYDLDFTNRTGPFALQEQGGMIAQYYGHIPTEWQPILGGPMAGGTSSIPIAARTNRGPAFIVFDPEQVGPTTAPTKQLLSFKIPNDVFQPYNDADSYAGFAWPTGYRGVLYLRKHGEPHCYGHGGLAPTECVDPTDSSKGNHAYPYEHWIEEFDANDFAAVKAGTLQPWQVKQTARWKLTELPGANDGTARLESAAYHQASRRWYVTAFSGSGIPRVYVYEIAPPPPTGIPDVDCVGTFGDWAGEWTACTLTSGQWTRTFEEQRQFYVSTEPSGSGMACPTSATHPLDFLRTTTQACAPVDATYTDWAYVSATEWAPEICPASAEQTRTETWTRKENTPARYGGQTFPTSEDRPTSQACTYIPETLDVTCTRIGQPVIVGDAQVASFQCAPPWSPTFTLTVPRP